MKFNFAHCSFLLLVLAGVGSVLVSAEELGSAASKVHDVGPVYYHKETDARTYVDSDGSYFAKGKDALVPKGATQVPSTDSDTPLITSKANSTSRHKGGEIHLKLKNTTENIAVGLHAFARSGEDDKPKALRLSSISVQGSNGKPEEINIPGNGRGSGSQIPMGSSKLIARPDGQITVYATIESWNGEAWTRYADKSIQLLFWWTYGHRRDILIANDPFEPNEIGDGRKALTKAFPTLSVGPVTASKSPSENVALNDLAISEVNGSRFESGKVSILPERGTKFVDEDAALSITIVDENGTALKADSTRFKCSKPHINKQGHFVFSITRDKGDELHVALIIKGLKLKGLPKNLSYEDGEISASISGPFGSYVDFWTLFRLQKEGNED